MFGITDYPAFIGAVLVFLAIPGPGNLALLTSTATGGRRGGISATLGVIAGDQVLMWAAVAGMAKRDRHAPKSVCTAHSAARGY